MKDNSQTTNNWEKIRLEEILIRMSNGTTENQTDKITSYPVTRIETISDGVINSKKVKYIESPSDVEKYRLQKGDVLFSHINSIKHIGKTAIYQNKPEILIHGMNLLLLRPNHKKIDYNFFYQYLNWEKTRNKFRSLAKKAVNQASINTTELGAVIFPVPPVVEQRGIAEVLGTVDEALRLTDQVIERTETLKRGLMQRLLTQGIGHTEFKDTPLGRIPKTWTILAIKEVGEVVTGSTPPTKNKEYYGDAYQFVSPKDITDTKYIYSTEKKLSNSGFKISREIPSNSILVICISSIDGIGKTIINVEKCITNQQINSIIVHDFNIDFIYYSILYYRKYLQLYATRSGGNFAILNKSNFEEFQLPIPSISEQVKISNILSSVDKKIDNTKNEIIKLHKIKVGLMQFLLSGEKRVELREDGLHRVGNS